MKHYVRTVEHCTPKLYVFSSKKKQKDFVEKFKRSKHIKSGNADFWLDLVFSGDVSHFDLEVTVK